MQDRLVSGEAGGGPGSALTVEENEQFYRRRRRMLLWACIVVVGVLVGIGLLALALYAWPLTALGAVALLLVQTVGLPLAVLVSSVLGGLLGALSLGIGLGSRQLAAWYKRNFHKRGAPPDGGEQTQEPKQQLGKCKVEQSGNRTSEQQTWSLKKMKLINAMQIFRQRSKVNAECDVVVREASDITRFVQDHQRGTAIRRLVIAKQGADPTFLARLGLFFNSYAVGTVVFTSEVGAELRNAITTLRGGDGVVYVPELSAAGIRPAVDCEQQQLLALQIHVQDKVRHQEQQWILACSSRPTAAAWIKPIDPAITTKADNDHFNVKENLEKSAQAANFQPIDSKEKNPSPGIAVSGGEGEGFKDNETNSAALELEKCKQKRVQFVTETTAKIAALGRRNQHLFEQLSAMLQGRCVAPISKKKEAAAAKFVSP